MTRQNHFDLAEECAAEARERLDENDSGEDEGPWLPPHPELPPQRPERTGSGQPVKNPEPPPDTPLPWEAGE